MAPFNQFKEELDKLRSQGNKLEPTLEKFLQEYRKQANEAERLLQEKQSLERDKPKFRKTIPLYTLSS